MKAVTTGEFAVPKGQFMRHLAGKFAWKTLVVLAAGVTVCAVLGIILDLRWFIVALMVVFILTPMLAALLYFNYGLRPEGFVNVLPHRVTIHPDGTIEAEAYFTVQNYEDEPDPWEKADEKWNKTEEDAEENSNENSDEETGEKPAPAEPERRSRTYRFIRSESRPYTAAGSGICIHLSAPARGSIIIPYHAFASPEELRTAVGYLCPT